MEYEGLQWFVSILSDPLSRKLCTKEFPDLEIFWILCPLAKNYNAYNLKNWKHLIIFALTSMSLKFNNDTYNYYFCHSVQFYFQFGKQKEITGAKSSK
jgi:hypothetical protein